MAVTSCQKTVRSWDFAATKKRGSDYTVGVLMQIDAQGIYTVLDVERFQGGPQEVRQIVINTAIQDGKDFLIAFPRDPGQAGIWQAAALSRDLAGWVLESSPESGSKEDRAKPFAAQVNCGNVQFIKDRPWNALYLEELKGFPNLKHNDQVDASSRAFANLVTPPKVYRRPTFRKGSLLTR